MGSRQDETERGQCLAFEIAPFLYGKKTEEVKRNLLSKGSTAGMNGNQSALEPV